MNNSDSRQDNTNISSIRTFSKDAESVRQNKDSSKVASTPSPIPKPAPDATEKSAVESDKSTNNKKGSFTAIPKPPTNKTEASVTTSIPVPKSTKEAEKPTTKESTSETFEDKKNQELKEKATKKIVSSSTKLSEKPDSILESTTEKNTIKTKEPEAVLVRDVKKKKVNFFGSVAESVIGGVKDFKNTYITPEKPSYTVSKSTRRAGVLESAKPKTGTALVSEENIAEKIKKRYEKNQELTDVKNTPEEEIILHTSDFVEELDKDTVKSSAQQEKPHDVEIVPRKKAGVLTYNSERNSNDSKKETPKTDSVKSTQQEEPKIQTSDNTETPIHTHHSDAKKPAPVPKASEEKKPETTTEQRITSDSKKIEKKPPEITKPSEKSAVAIPEKKTISKKPDPTVFATKKDDRTQNRLPAPKPPVRKEVSDEQAEARWGIDTNTENNTAESKASTLKKDTSTAQPIEKTSDSPFSFTYKKPSTSEDAKKPAPVPKASEEKKPETTTEQRITSDSKKIEKKPPEITKPSEKSAVTTIPTPLPVAEEKTGTLSTETTTVPDPDEILETKQTTTTEKAQVIPPQEEYVYPSDDTDDEDVPKDNSTNELSLKILLGTIFLFIVGLVGLHLYDTHFVPAKDPTLLVGDNVTVFRLEEYPNPQARYNGLIEKAQTTNAIAHIAIYEPRHQTSIRQKVRDTIELLELQIDSTIRNVTHDIHFGAIDSELAFIVLEITDNRQALGGMLAWESQLSEVLTPLFGNISSDLNFIDVTSRNSDVRAGVNESEDIEIAYSVTSDMVIITTTLTQLEKILQARR